MQNMIVCKLMINKHEAICAGVYWNGAVVPGCKLWWCMYSV